MAKVTFDSVTEDPANDEFVIYLIEDGNLPQEGPHQVARLREIQARIYNTLDAVLDGPLLKLYPEAAGRGIRIQVDSPWGEHPRLRALVASMCELMAGDSDYGRAIRASLFRSVRLVTGREMGRFGGNDLTKN